MDDYRAEIACLHRHGLMVEALPDGSGWNFPAGPIPPDAPQLERSCELEAFGG
jgi:hypothetical protein